MIRSVTGAYAHGIVSRCTAAQDPGAIRGLFRMVDP
jgi:hypothetical protein